ncbi:MAG: hydroxymethylbilane synthase [Eggerthellaceae bacterium]|nr:hydroxymethylbilane synthase [Eggerthellaceae bacterium]
MGADRVVIGSRESLLAVAQSNLVIDFLRAAHPGLDVELATFKTTGDKILDRRLDQIGGKGLFVKELDDALRAGKCDYTVHSCKDLPMEAPGDLPIVCFSAREDPRDVLVFPCGAEEPDFSLPVGTSSLRRELQLRRLLPQAQFESVRGNLQTRLRKLDEGQYGCLVLAAAGLKRLGLEERIGRYLEPDKVIPSAAQGVIAVQGRTDADADLLDGFASHDAFVTTSAERAFVAYLDGGCSSPIAAYAETEDGNVVLRALYYDEETRVARRGTIYGSAGDAVPMAEALADALRSGGGEEL